MTKYNKVLFLINRFHGNPATLIIKDGNLKLEMHIIHIQEVSEIYSKMEMNILM